jgi:pyruvate,water dikinase
MPDEMKPVLGAMFGQMDSTSTATEVRGLGASPGVVIGVARIIDNLDDADRLEDGDVLIAKTTSPPWTPLFGVAAAVVTDAGGPMSHVAIVAREYGIPAVVGTVEATKLIRDGQRVRVDGSAGTVELLEG